MTTHGLRPRESNAGRNGNPLRQSSAERHPDQQAVPWGQKGDGSPLWIDLQRGQNRLGLRPELGRRVSAEHHPRIEEPVCFEEAEQLRPRLNASLPDLRRAEHGRLEAMRPWREVPLKPLKGLVLGRAELRKREEGLSPRDRLTFGERRESHRCGLRGCPRASHRAGGSTSVTSSAESGWLSRCARSHQRATWGDAAPFAAQARSSGLGAARRRPCLAPLSRCTR